MTQFKLDFDENIGHKENSEQDKEMRYKKIIKLSEITLKNFRCYKNITLKLEDKLTVLVANNGGGKTAILDAISIALWSFVGEFDLSSNLPKSKSISSEDIRIILDDRLSDGFELNKYGKMIRQIPTEIISIATIYDNEYRWKRYKDNENGKAKTKGDLGNNKLKKLASKLQIDIRDSQKNIITLPLLVYYGTGRLWKEKRLTESKKSSNKDHKFIRTFSYKDSLDPASSYKQFEDWFSSLHGILFEAYQRGYEQNNSKEIDAFNAFNTVQLAVNKALSSVGWKNPIYSGSDEEITLEHEKYGRLKISQLSDGIQNVFGLIADIIYRCILLNPHLGNDAVRETEGIVMIDEIDMHLHPSWQQVILLHLQEIFPKIQFIVTTHSPQVLSTVPRQSIRIIYEDEVIIPHSQTEGSASGFVMSLVQGVNEAPDIDIVKNVNKYRNFIEQKYDEYEKCGDIKKLEEIIKLHYGETHYIWIELMNLIRVKEMKKRMESLKNEKIRTLK